MNSNRNRSATFSVFVNTIPAQFANDWNFFVHQPIYHACVCRSGDELRNSNLTATEWCWAEMLCEAHTYTQTDNMWTCEHKRARRVNVYKLSDWHACICICMRTTDRQFDSFTIVKKREEKNMSTRCTQMWKMNQVRQSLETFSVASIYLWIHKMWAKSKFWFSRIF